MPEDADVQPDEGQGTEATGGLFDTYLEGVPEDGRETDTQYLKDASKNFEGRLQEASQLEKRFGAYNDIDLAQYQPEQLSELLGWHQQFVANEEPDGEGLDSAAHEAGYTKAEPEDLGQLETEGEHTREQIEQQV